jgi:hypothetical protein
MEQAVKGTPTVFLDSTPNYMFAPAVAPRIKQAIPDAKFIIVLRVRPVSRYLPCESLAFLFAVLPFTNCVTLLWVTESAGFRMSRMRANSSH